MNPIDAHIGGRLRHYRVRAGLSQDELGKRIGLSFQQIQKYEKGANRISAAGLLEIGTELGVPPHSFYEGIPAFDSLVKQKGSSLDEGLTAFLSSKPGLSLARDFMRISDKGLQRQMAALIRKLSQVKS